jgi:hypothetical protein
MKSKLVGLIAIALLVAPSATALGSQSDPFVGPWVGTDGTDGSRNMLIVGGGDNHVVYQESGVTACKNAFGLDHLVRGSVAGFATIDGDTLTFTGTLYCNLEEGRTAHPFFQNFVWVVRYDAGTDTVQLDADPSTTLSRPGS